METLQNIFINSIKLTENHFQMFVNLMQVKYLGVKDFFVKEGTVCNSIGFIRTGVLRSFVLGNDKEYNTDFYFQDYFVSSYSSFITQTASEHSIQAITDAEVCYITFNEYSKLMATDSDWLKLGKYVAEFFLIRKCKREVSFLKQTAAERMETLLETYPDIEQVVPQYHIASYLGIKPESLSRIKMYGYLGNKKALP